MFHVESDRQSAVRSTASEVARSAFIPGHDVPSYEPDPFPSAPGSVAAATPAPAAAVVDVDPRHARIGHGRRRSSEGMKLGVAGLLCAAVFGVGCGAASGSGTSDGDDVVSTSQAIVHGAADGDRHPAVVALVAVDASGTALCSGTLIADDVVLTARHCVTELTSDAVTCLVKVGPKKVAPKAGNTSSAATSIGALRVASSIHIIAGDVVSTGKEVAVGAEIIVPSRGALCGSDLALIKLDRAVAGAKVATIATIAPKVGEKITSVGYGLLTSTSGAGTKRFRTGVPITDVDADELAVGEDTCSGDSGGPALDPTTGDIVGVVSRGSTPCDATTATNIYTRIDAFAAWIEKEAGVKGGVGATPKGDADAGTDKDGDKDAGKESDAGADDGKDDLGAACTDGATCASGLCAKSTTESVCSRTCGVKDPCPDGFRCEHAKAGDAGACMAHK